MSSSTRHNQAQRQEQAQLRRIAAQVQAHPRLILGLNGAVLDHTAQILTTHFFGGSSSGGSSSGGSSSGGSSSGGSSSGRLPRLDRDEQKTIVETPTLPAFDLLQFSAYHPKEAALQDWNSLLVYSLIESALEEVRVDANKFTELVRGVGTAPRTLMASAERPLARGTEITIVPSLSEVTFDPPQMTFTWREDWHRSLFQFKGDADLRERSSNGEIAIYAGSLILAAIPISVYFVQVEEEATASASGHSGAVESTAKPFRNVFASYSHSDTAVVIACRNAYTALGDSVLIDIDSLRSGEDFGEALKRLIDAADVFQLFWSERSAASTYVRDEWTYALSKTRPENFIRPVYWEKPMINPPPQLGHLHFSFVQLPKDHSFLVTSPLEEELVRAESAIHSHSWLSAINIADWVRDKAKEAGNTNVETRALVLLCHAYLGQTIADSEATHDQVGLFRLLARDEEGLTRARRAGETALEIARKEKNVVDERGAQFALFRVSWEIAKHRRKSAEALKEVAEKFNASVQEETDAAEHFFSESQI
jgi:hypothetical protein